MRYLASQGAESERASEPLCGCAACARDSLFWLDNFVFAGAGWIGMRWTQTDCGAAACAYAAFEHAIGHRSICKALNECAGNAFEQVAKARQTAGTSGSGWLHRRRKCFVVWRAVQRAARFERRNLRHV